MVVKIYSYWIAPGYTLNNPYKGLPGSGGTVTGTMAVVKKGGTSVRWAPHTKLVQH